MCVAQVVQTNRSTLQLHPRTANLIILGRKSGDLSGADFVNNVYRNWHEQ